MFKLHLGATALSLAAVLVACSTHQPSENLGQTSQNIQGGAADGTAHPFVVGISFNTNTGPATCSGALSLPNVVLTARHCVQETMDADPKMGVVCPTSTFLGPVGFGSTASYVVTTSSVIPGAKASQHGVKQIVTPPSTEFCGNDIAILILSSTVSAVEATPAIPNTRYSLTDQDHYNSNAGFTAIGYGITSPTSNDSGTRRILKNISTICIPGDCSIDCAKGGVPTDKFTDNEFIGGDGPCEGDSGSAAWEQSPFDNGQFIAMGVLSRGGADKTTNTCVNSFYTRIDSWHDLIVQAAGTASNNWALYPKPTPDWTVYTPPPACPSGGGTAGKDGGTNPDAGGSKGFGEACTQDSQCASKQCYSTASGFACTQACKAGDATTCPAGFTCDKDALLCLAASDGGPPNHATSTTSGGCAMAPAPEPSKPVPWKTLGVVAVLGLAIRRRRS